MGRTVRKSKSQYAAINRETRRSAHTTTGRETVLPRQRQQPTNSGRTTTDSVPSTSSASAPPQLSREDLEIVAKSVTEKMVPEIHDHITQAVAAMHQSPTNSASPDTERQSSELGTCNINNDCLINDHNVVPISSINDDLGLHVSLRLRDKIVNGEYIELGSLLTHGAADLSKSIVVDNQGNLNIRQKSDKKINDINAWLDAFLIFTSIYTRAHTESTQGLLKYMFNIKLGANRAQGLGWKEYDQQFRLKKARIPSMPWGVIDMELWLLFIPQGLAPQNPISEAKCFDYNNKGRCTRPLCRYSHKCLKCNGSHSAMFCSLTESNQSNIHTKVHKKNETGQCDINTQNAGFRFRNGRTN